VKLHRIVLSAVVFAAAVALLPMPSLAQSTMGASATPDRVKTLAAEWRRAKLGTQEFIDAMPEANLGFQPTPEIRSFAQQMLHIAGGNFGFGTAASGQKNPYEGQDLEKLPDVLTSKAALRKVVLESYDFMIRGAEGLSAASLDEEISFFNTKMTRALVYAKAIEHHAHHRGQTVIYLRLKGITPPSERLF